MEGSIASRSPVTALGKLAVQETSGAVFLVLVFPRPTSSGRSCQQAHVDALHMHLLNTRKTGCTYQGDSK